MMEAMEQQKAQASAWFRTLRDEIVAAFEALEDRQVADLPAGRFEVNETTRTSDDGSDAGGGLMSVMRGGRVFEKVGVNISTVYGNSVMRHKRRWPRAVSPVWKAIRAFGPRAFRWSRICRTRMPQRCI